MCDCELCDCDSPVPPLAVTVEKVVNGYIVDGPEAKLVFGNDEASERSDCEATATMLYGVLEQLGELGTKHDKYRCRICVIERDTGRDVMGGD
jgi:hypothetical protein